MRLYRIKHKPTGLFYCPVRGFGSRKTNLSKNGKVYTKKPTFAHMTHGFNFSDKLKKETMCHMCKCRFFCEYYHF